MTRLLLLRGISLICSIMKNRKLEVLAVTITIVWVMVTASCTHQASIIPDVGFGRDILPIVQTSCAINSNCHIGASNANGHIDLSDSAAYNTFMQKGLINTKAPSSSLLYSEINTGFMPKAPYTHLSSTEIHLVLSWIKQGAKNN